MRNELKWLERARETVADIIVDLFIIYAHTHSHSDIIISAKCTEHDENEHERNKKQQLKIVTTTTRLLFLHGTFNCSLSSDSNSDNRTLVWYGMECYVYVEHGIHTVMRDCQNAVRTKRCWRTTTTKSRWRKWRRANYGNVFVCCVYFFSALVSFVRYRFDVCECFFFSFF